MQARLKSILTPKKRNEIIIPTNWTMIAEQTVKVPLNKFPITSPEAVKAIFQAALKNADREMVMVMYMDSDNMFLGIQPAAWGTIDRVLCTARQIYSIVLGDPRTKSFIVGHNHLSDNVEMSEEDFEMMEHIRRGAGYLDVDFLDFIIVGTNQDAYYSHRDHNYKMK